MLSFEKFKLFDIFGNVLQFWRNGIQEFGNVYMCLILRGFRCNFKDTACDRCVQVTGGSLKESKEALAIAETDGVF